ncbi:MAG: hypothetical protein IPK44_06670 [Candidatus Accumulibacter sp.]|uniref:hypothetical protein n=1 Tax=Accumulibacter sp. TaxID=2053492 RepID=UPI00259085BC|nr:hypothetical protein [Accumulibacter sp.]MBK8114234.1 hypothetical protein [Accumulibacter sp.]
MDKMIVPSASTEIEEEAYRSPSSSQFNEKYKKLHGLLLKMVMGLFVISLFVPSIKGPNIIFLGKQTYSIINIVTGVFYLTSTGIHISLIMLTGFFVLMPAFNMLALFRIARHSTNGPSKFTLLIAVFFHKYQPINIFFLVASLAILEFKALAKMGMESLAGIYLYFISIVTLTIVSRIIINSIGGIDAALANATEIINSYKITLVRHIKIALKIAIALTLIFFVAKVAGPQILEITDQAVTAIKLKNTPESASAETSSSDPTARDKAVAESYNDLNTKSSDFDVGGYCLEKEKRINIKFEECIAVATAKLKSK